MRQKVLIGILFLGLLGIVAISFAPPQPQYEQAKKPSFVWQASIDFVEQGKIEHKYLCSSTEWRKTAQAKFKFVSYESTGEGLAWEDAVVHYSDSAKEVVCSADLGPYVKSDHDISGSVSFRSQKDMDEKGPQLEQLLKGGAPDYCGIYLVGLQMYRHGNKIYVLEHPAIAVGGSRAGAKNRWERDKGSYKVDLSFKISGALPQRSKEEQEKYNKEMEQKMIAEMAKTMKSTVPQKMTKKDVEAAKQSQEASYVASLLALGATELGDKNAVEGSRNWGPTEEDLQGRVDWKVNISRSLSWSFKFVSEETSVKIIEPQADAQYIFGEKAPRQLEIIAKAKVEPADGAGEVEWEVEDIQGSRKTIKPLKGEEVKITFDRLPENNDEFGPKKITAKVRDKQGQVRQDQVTVKVFFAKDERDNPEGKYPNWFYYWRQGAVDSLERFVYDPQARSPWGEYDFDNKKLIIGPKGAEHMIAIQMPSKTVQRPAYPPCTSKSINVPATDGIDTTARVVAHELEHEKRLNESGSGKIGWDRDNDFVLDTFELTSDYCLSATDTNTLKLTAEGLGFLPGTAEAQAMQRMLEMTGDGELLAIAAEQAYLKRVKRDKDWACPGSQFKK